MKILVIGCGSIGQRHIKNLISLNAGTLFAFDIDKKRREQVKRISPKITVYSVLGQLWKHSPGVAFITVPTSLHVRYALEAAEKGCHLFVEKPLSNSINSINRLCKVIKDKRLITLVGCNMRFYWAVKKIKKLLSRNSIGKIVSVRIETGQYLPDWHPYEDYRKLYSASKKLGGGVFLDAIHEIDYAMWFFGKIKNSICMYGRLSNLKIETEDVAEILLKFNSGPIVNIHMDYVYRDYLRNCRVIGEEGTIIWDYIAHSLRLYLAEIKKTIVFKEPADYSLNQMYVDELKYFLYCVKNNINTFNNISNGLDVLKTALRLKNCGIYVK